LSEEASIDGGQKHTIIDLDSKITCFQRSITKSYKQAQLKYKNL